MQETGFTGSYALQIVPSSRWRRQVWQDVLVTPGLTYNAGVWVATAGVADTELKVVVAWLDAWTPTLGRIKEHLIRRDVVGTLSGTTTWTWVSGSFVAPAGAVSARLHLSVGKERDGRGAVWMDDAEIRECGSILLSGELPAKAGASRAFLRGRN